MSERIEDLAVTRGPRSAEPDKPADKMQAEVLASSYSVPVMAGDGPADHISSETNSSMPAGDQSQLPPKRRELPILPLEIAPLEIAGAAGLAAVVAAAVYPPLWPVVVIVGLTDGIVLGSEGYR